MCKAICYGNAGWCTTGLLVDKNRVHILHLILLLLLVSFHITSVFSQNGPARLNGHGPFYRKARQKFGAEKIDA